jgi:hypothetical protein
MYYEATKMSKSRALFLAISRMPTALMLVIIISAVVTLTMWLTATENGLQASAVRNAVGEAVASDPNTAAVHSDRPHKKVLYALSYLPANAPIEAKQVALRDVDDLQAFDDAEQLTTNVIGKAPAHGIPENAQIRKIDLP